MLRDALEVAIHEWFAVCSVVFPSSLTELKDIAKIIANIAVASVPYLIANSNSCRGHTRTWSPTPQTQLVRESMSRRMLRRLYANVNALLFI
jgi:hypothetical protein